MAATILATVALVLAGCSATYAITTRRTLTHLRRNCFVTNERGHRVRYFHASPEVRAKAERSKGAAA